MYLDWQHIVGLFVLGIPIACIARTVVFEEIFREPREWCIKSQTCRSSSASSSTSSPASTASATGSRPAFLILTRFKLMYDDFRGYIISFFSLVFVANISESLRPSAGGHHQ